MNKFDEKDKIMRWSRKLIRKTICKKNQMSQRESIKSDQELFNFNDIINLQLDEVKQNTLSFFR